MIHETEPALFWGALAITATLLFGIGMDVHRRLKARERPNRSPVGHWIGTLVVLWVLAGVALWAWTESGRSLADFGFTTQPGWRSWIGWALAAGFLLPQILQLWAVYRRQDMRQEVRKIVFDSGDYDIVMPRRRKDVWGFQLLAVTAGITEEIIFRAFFIGLFALFMPVWAAAVLALAMFILGHAYQGLQGFVRILPVSLVLTVIFVLSGSIWPAILLHVAVDLLSGVMAWFVLPKAGYVESIPEGAGAEAQPVL